MLGGGIVLTLVQGCLRASRVKLWWQEDSDPIIIQVAEVEEGEVATCYARGRGRSIKSESVHRSVLSNPFATPMSYSLPAPLIHGIPPSRILSGLLFLSRRSSQLRG